MSCGLQRKIARLSGEGDSEIFIVFYGSFGWVPFLEKWNFFIPIVAPNRNQKFHRYPNPKYLTSFHTEEAIKRV
jgi:hypothetical protein